MAINTDMSLKSTKEFDEQVSTVQELLDSPLANFITLAAKDCGFAGTSEDLIVNCIHPLILKAKAAASAEDNPTWKQAFEGAFFEKYW